MDEAILSRVAETAQHLRLWDRLLIAWDCASSLSFRDLEEVHRKVLAMDAELEAPAGSTTLSHYLHAMHLVSSDRARAERTQISYGRPALQVEQQAPMATAAVTLHISPELQLKAPLSTALREAAEGRVTVEELESSAAPLPWALVQADFNYVLQSLRPGPPVLRALQDPFAPLGTRCAAALCFAEATQATSAVEALSAWWPSKAAECPGARLLLVLIGPKQASLRVDAAECLTEALLTLQMDFVEVRDWADRMRNQPPLAAAYAVQCAESVAKSRGRALPSRFKVAGAKCQTLPKDPSDRLATTWVSQLMQVQGMSEDLWPRVRHEMLHCH
eukprot:g16179.t1